MRIQLNKVAGNLGNKYWRMMLLIKCRIITKILFNRMQVIYYNLSGISLSMNLVANLIQEKGI